MGSDTCKLRGSESPVRIDIGVSWKEIEETRAETENGNMKTPEQIVHMQDTIADSCLEYELDEVGSGLARSGAARLDQAGLGTARQGEDSKTNLKEVGEKTEDYFKRVNVFSLVNVRPASARHGVAWQNPTRPGRTRQDKELNNEDL